MVGHPTELTLQNCGLVYHIWIQQFGYGPFTAQKKKQSSFFYFRGITNHAEKISDIEQITGMLPVQCRNDFTAPQLFMGYDPDFTEFIESFLSLIAQYHEFRTTDNAPVNLVHFDFNGYLTGCADELKFFSCTLRIIEMEQRHTFPQPILYPFQC